MNKCQVTRPWPTVAIAALCTSMISSAYGQDLPNTVTIGPNAGIPQAEDGVSYTENFETGFTLGPGCNQNGWTCAATQQFQIVNSGIAGFGSFSARSTSNGSGTAVAGVMRSPIFTLETGRIEADLVISDNVSLTQFTSVNTLAGAGFFNTRVNFEANGAINVLQISGPPPCTTGVFSPTTGTWTPGVKFRIGVEVLPGNVLRVYKDGVQIFSGIDIAQHCSDGDPDIGINQIRDFHSNVAGSTTTFTLDNVAPSGGNPCLQPLPPCRSDIAGPNNGPPDGATNVVDLLACINTWGQNGNPNGPRPLGDCDPLPNGNCFVNVGDMLAIINGWGPCPQPTGACCLPNGQCLANVTQSNCTGQGGTFQGNGSSCPTNPPCPVVPPNDNCSGAIAVGNGSHNIDNTGATNSTGVPGGACIFGGAANISKDIWYKYTATCTGNVTVDLCSTTGSVTDTTLQVYSGTCASLTEVACDDDACTGNPAGDRSRATFSATQGTEYLIRVGVWGANAPGPMVLTIGCALPNNDFCNEATSVAIPSTTNGSILGATADQAPVCDNVQMSKARWYKVVGNGNTLTASLCSSPFELWDSRLSVYCGPACSTLFCVVAADDTCGAHAEVSWCSAPGQTYYIAVHTPDTVTAPEGNYVLQVTSGGACGNPLPCGLVNDSCQGAIDVTANIGGADVNGDNTNATPTAGGDTELPAGSPTCQWNGQPTAVHNTLWYKFTAPNPAVPGVTVETCPSTTPFTDSIIAIYSGSCGGLTQVACGEDECAGDAYYSSATVQNPVPGQTYYVMVGSTGAWTGSIPGPFKLRLTVFTPCTWTCPPGSNVEGEPCLVDGATDTTNGGCNSTPTVYSTNLTVNGPAVCGNGSTRVNGATQTRDTDWYHITPSSTTTYRITVNAEFTALIGFVQGVGTIGGPCSGAAFVAGSTATTTGNCNQVTSPATTLTSNVNYAVFVAPSVFSGWPCSGGQNDYWVRLISP